MESPDIQEILEVLREISGTSLSLHNAQQQILARCGQSLVVEKLPLTEKKPSFCFCCHSPLRRRGVSHPLWRDDRVCERCQDLQRCVVCERRCGKQPFYLNTNDQTSFGFTARQIGNYAGRSPLFICPQCAASGTTVECEGLNVAEKTLQKVVHRLKSLQIDFSLVNPPVEFHQDRHSHAAAQQRDRRSVLVELVDIHCLSRPKQSEDRLSSAPFTFRNPGRGRRDWGEDLVFGRCESLEHPDNCMPPVRLRVIQACTGNDHGLPRDWFQQKVPERSVPTEKQDYYRRVPHCKPNYTKLIRPTANSSLTSRRHSIYQNKPVRRIMINRGSEKVATKTTQISTIRNTVVLAPSNRNSVERDSDERKLLRRNPLFHSLQPVTHKNPIPVVNGLWISPADLKQGEKRRTAALSNAQRAGPTRNHQRDFDSHLFSAGSMNRGLESRVPNQSTPARLTLSRQRMASESLRGTRSCSVQPPQQRRLILPIDRTPKLVVRNSRCPLQTVDASSCSRSPVSRPPRSSWPDNQPTSRSQRIERQGRTLRGIAIAAGLPEDIFASTLAHELTHAYIFCTGYSLPMIAEEGICNAVCLLYVLNRSNRYALLIQGLNACIEQPHKCCHRLGKLLHEYFPMEFEKRLPHTNNTGQQARLLSGPKSDFNPWNLPTHHQLLLLRHRLILRQRLCVYRFRRMMIGDIQEYLAATLILPVLLQHGLHYCLEMFHRHHTKLRTAC